SAVRRPSGFALSLLPKPAHHNLFLESRIYRYSLEAVALPSQSAPGFAADAAQRSHVGAFSSRVTYAIIVAG
ncbi:hypothetical protein SB861_53965, partial [Paraburkholderia sp. SIMBA_049]